MSTQDRTTEALSNAVEQDLEDEYILSYNSHGDVLPDDVVAALVKGESVWETRGGEALMEWESEVRWAAACDAVDEHAKEVIRHWEREDDGDYNYLLDGDWSASDERMSLIYDVQERDRSEWFSELVNQHGGVLLRVTIKAMDEDAGLSYTAVTREQFLDLLGFDHTDNNMRLAGDVIDNAATEFSVAIGQALIGVDLETVANLPVSGDVELRNPHVWLGNPFAGSGWCSEDAFTGTLTVNRCDLHTDEDAFGYSWNDVVGGASPSDYSGEAAAAAEPA